MTTTSKNFGWVKDSVIIILVMALLINWRTPTTEYVYVQEPMYIDVEKEITKEVTQEKPIYIEVPIFIEVKPNEERKAKERVIPYTSQKISGSTGFKSFMRYTAITKKGSNPWKLQQWAHTDGEGFRIYEGRYLMALGTGTGAKVGDYVDIVLANGTHIPAIMGDTKSDKHTDASNIFGVNGCCSEFIIDDNYLIQSVKTSGDCSNARAEWQSPVVAINVLERSVF